MTNIYVILISLISPSSSLNNISSLQKLKVLLVELGQEQNNYGFTICACDWANLPGLRLPTSPVPTPNVTWFHQEHDPGFAGEP